MDVEASSDFLDAGVEGGAEGIVLDGIAEEEHEVQFNVGFGDAVVDDADVGVGGLGEGIWWRIKPVAGALGWLIGNHGILYGLWKITFVRSNSTVA